MYPKPTYYSRWGGAPVSNVTPVLAPSRSRPRRPILSSLKAAMGIPPSASDPIRCWGPAWDRSCKVCVPLPNGGESCTSFKVNDAQRPQGGGPGPGQRLYASR